MKTFKTTGVVYGKLWGGGFGAYPAEKLYNNEKGELLKEAKKLLKTGGLDSGMGYEYLKGALLEIEEIETIEIKGKEYQRSEYSLEYIGDLTQKEKLFLRQCQVNSY